MIAPTMSRRWIAIELVESAGGRRGPRRFGGA
jgi:hypothetical protein